jgi:hypothetical protein
VHALLEESRRNAKITERSDFQYSCEMLFSVQLVEEAIIRMKSCTLTSFEPQYNSFAALEVSKTRRNVAD